MVGQVSMMCRSIKEYYLKKNLLRIVVFYHTLTLHLSFWMKMKNNLLKIEMLLVYLWICYASENRNKNNDVETNFMDICSLNRANKNNHIYNMFLQIRQVILLDSNYYILVGLTLYIIHHPFYY